MHARVRASRQELASECTISGRCGELPVSAIRDAGSGRRRPVVRAPSTTPRRRKASWSSFSSRAGPCRSSASTTMTMPASPFEVAQPGFVGLDAIDVRGVSVVLDRDPQLSSAEIKAVHLATVDGADGDVRLRYGKPEVDNQPEQPALRGRVGAAGRQVDESPTDTGAARIGPSCSRSRRRRRNAGRFGSGSAGEGLVDHGQCFREARQCTAGRRRLVPGREPGRPCRSSRSSTSAQPLWRTMPSRSPLRCLVRQHEVDRCRAGARSDAVQVGGRRTGQDRVRPDREPRSGDDTSVARSPGLRRPGRPCKGATTSPMRRAERTR